MPCLKNKASKSSKDLNARSRLRQMHFNLLRTVTTTKQASIYCCRDDGEWGLKHKKVCNIFPYHPRSWMPEPTIHFARAVRKKAQPENALSLNTVDACAYGTGRFRTKSNPADSETKNASHAPRRSGFVECTGIPADLNFSLLLFYYLAYTFLRGSESPQNSMCL